MELAAYLARCEATLEVEPGDTQANFDFILGSEMLGRTEVSKNALKDWMAARPNCNEALYLQGLLARFKNESADQWGELFEYGLRCGKRGPVIKTSSKVWAGPDEMVESLLIISENGLGDFFRHAVHLERVQNVAKRCILACPAKLIELASRLWPLFDVMAIEGFDDDNATYDRYIYSGSLDRFFWNAETAPQKSGYFSKTKLNSEVWRDWLRTLSPKGKNIGFCFRSHMHNPLRDHYYSVLNDWCPVFGLEGFNFISLQYDCDPSEIYDFGHEAGFKIYVPPNLDQMNDLANVAGLISELDIVVSVGTMVADLSNALGIPTWRLHPGPLGCRAGRQEKTNPWYGAATTLYIRPGQDEWAGVMRSIRNDLSRGLPS